MKLRTRYVEKPWGRMGLPAIFAGVPDQRIGDVWFVADEPRPLLAKYIFTSDRLSVQVHPRDEQARALGLKSGKSECWYILDADPGSTIGLGLRREASREELRSSALDGSIVDLIDWRPVKAGDFLYVPPGTIHAIGGGISLLEFQQNCDVTFRLYDYGRPRQLHLDDAVAVASLTSYPDNLAKRVDPMEDAILVDGPDFTLLHAHADAIQDRRRWILPLEGTVRVGPTIVGAGECYLAEPEEIAEAEDARIIIGAAG
jgi:mannose-6-phosphate isomerase